MQGLEGVFPVGAAFPIQGGEPATAVQPGLFMHELDKLNHTVTSSEALLQDLAAGKTDNIHHVMLALEDAKLTLQMALQVRNKVVEGYQEILRMQI
jgi:flagellar hook-basal body complex protein FliE